MSVHHDTQTMEEVRAVVRRVNEHLQRQLWYELEVWRYTGETLLVCGGIDIFVSYDVQLRFSGVFFMSTPMEWHVDTKAPPLELLSGDDARAVNQQFQVEVGHHLFAFHLEHYPPGSRGLIGARRLEVEFHEPRRRGA